MPRKKTAEDEWVTSREAVLILSRNAGRKISPGTLRNLAFTAKPSQIRTKTEDEVWYGGEGERGEGERRRGVLYNRADVEKITLRARKTKAEMAQAEN